MICVYPADCTDFSTNGNGTLSPLSAEVTETLNGEYELTLVHPIDEAGKWQRLVEGCILRAPVPAAMTPRVNFTAPGDDNRTEVWRVNTDFSGAETRKGTLRMRSGPGTKFTRCWRPIRSSHPRWGVAYGGTGATSAAAAIAALGGVKKSGDTMIGNLNISGYLYPSMLLLPTYNDTTNRTVFEGSYIGASSFAAWEDITVNNRRMLEVRTKSYQSSACGPVYAYV